MSGFGVTPLTPCPPSSVFHYTTIYYSHHSHFESKVIKYGGAKQLLLHSLHKAHCYNQDLILTTTTPGNTKPQHGGALTTKPQCRQTTSSWIWSSTKCVCLHSGHAITTFCVLVDCILLSSIPLMNMFVPLLVLVGGCLE